MLPSYTVALTALVALLSAVPASAHMEMLEPAPFRSKNNKSPGVQIDYSMTEPLKPDGSDFPCKGYHTDFDGPSGAPTTSIAAGSSTSITLGGSAVHGGGSCQISLSYDKGNTWEVLKSFLGNCPSGPGATLKYDMPADVQAGKAILGWTWFGKQGGRPEMYMNCAAVEITGGGGAAKRAARPAMFVANVGDKGNGCMTVSDTDVKFPDPGAAVEEAPGANLQPPNGNCGAAGPAAPPAPPAEKPAEKPKDAAPQPPPQPTAQANPSPAPIASTGPKDTTPKLGGVQAPQSNEPPAAVKATNPQCKRWRRKGSA